MKARTLLGVTFLVVLAAVAATFFFSLRAYQDTLREYERAAREHDRADDAVRVMRHTALDMETGVRGWLVTRDRRFLEPYEHASDGRARAEEELVAAMSADPASRRAAEHVRAELEAWHREVAVPLVAPEVFARSDADRLALNVDGKERMDRVRADLVTLRGTVRALRSGESATLDAYLTTLTSRKVSTGLMLTLVLGLAWLGILRWIERPLGEVLEVANRPLGEELAPGADPMVDEIARVRRALLEMRGRLADELSRERRFGELVTTLTGGGSLAELGREATERLAKDHHAAAAVLWFSRGDGSPLRRIASLGIDAEALPSGGGPIAREARAKKKTIRVERLGEDEGLVVRSSLLTASVSAATAAPILAGDRVVGVLELAGAPVDEAELARGLARVALALEGAAERDNNAALAEELRAINERLAAQNEELRQQEDELRAQSGQIEKRERELSARNAELADASRAKSTFLSSMSHELRTPLNAVTGFAEVLLADTYGPLGEPQRRAVGDIQAAGRQLLALVNDVLDLAKVEAGRLEVRLGTVDAVGVLGDACNLLAAVSRRRRITVQHDTKGTIACVADGDRLRQVLVNLVGNAIKFSPEGGKVKVDVTRAGDVVRFDVIDEGPGISPDDAASLFQPFSQLEGPNRHLGTGLGLVIAKHLVTLMHGTIELRSGPGKGSTFSVTLPAASTATLVPSRARGLTPPSGMRAVKAGRILLVEDEPSDARVLEGLLGRAGHRVRIEPTAEAGLGALGEARFDCAIVDLRLPGMSGVELVDAIRADRTLRRTRLVVLTGTILEPAARAALEAKVDLLADKGVMTDGGFLDAIGSLLASQLGGRVLVVDDNEANRRVARAMLESVGHTVEEAASGEDALDRIAKSAPDVVLMDVRMPGLSGLEVTARLREREETRRVSIIAVSAQAMRGDRERALAAGCMDYVTKPVARAELLRAVERALEGARRQPEPSAAPRSSTSP
jgi:signal transduction histidine kinase/DNA-binding response OmpR family regulator/CHASE3 domain sensor protein